VASTLAEDVYVRLKRQIISLEIQPGDALTEGELAKRYAISKTPVREALGRLQREGLVDVTARSGYRVSAITIKDTRDLFGLRTILEVEASALAAAAPRKDPDTMREIEQLSHATFQPDDVESITAYLKQNTEFHTLIAKLGGNDRLASQLHDVLTELERVIHLSLQLLPIEVVHDIEHTHEALIDAITAGDAERTREVTLRQNAAFEARIIDALINSPVILTTNLGGLDRATAASH
jgi:GntR family transcriptional regulator, rspAB operon transcriptional repressor